MVSKLACKHTKVREESVKVSSLPPCVLGIKLRFLGLATSTFPPEQSLQPTVKGLYRSKMQRVDLGFIIQE